jgi:hypothetical protein
MNNDGETLFDDNDGLDNTIKVDVKETKFNKYSKDKNQKNQRSSELDKRDENVAINDEKIDLIGLN